VADDISVWVNDEHIRLHHRYQAALAAYESGTASTAPLAQREGPKLKRAVNEARDRLRAFEKEHGLNVVN
jgi:hypothetical protein